MSHVDNLYEVVRDAAMDMIYNELSAAENGSLITNKDKQMSFDGSDEILTGGFDYMFIAYPGAMPLGVYIGTTDEAVTPEVLIDCLVRWNTKEKEAWARFQSMRSILFNLFNRTEKGRTLNRTAGVSDSSVSFSERPRYIPQKGGGKNGIAFIAQVMMLRPEMRVSRIPKYEE